MQQPLAPKPAQSFLRKWGMLIAFALFAVAAFVLFRYWTEGKANEPVVKEYAAFLDHMAEGSSNAKAYRDRYYLQFGRTSVASRHFEQVCGAMYQQATMQGAAVRSYSEHMAQACKQFAQSYGSEALPK